MNIHITKATRVDSEAISTLYFHTWVATYPNKSLEISKEDLEEWLRPSLSTEKIEAHQKWLDNLPKSKQVLVAKDSDKIIGFCYVSKGNKTENNKLHAIYVSPSYHDKGVGKKLWHEAKKFLDLNLQTDVQVVAYNEKATRFYKKLGFTDTGERVTNNEEYRLRNGTIIPLANMVLNGVRPQKELV